MKSDTHFDRAALLRHWHVKRSSSRPLKIWHWVADGLLRFSFCGWSTRCLSMCSPRHLLFDMRCAREVSLSGRGFSTLVASCSTQFPWGRVDFRCLEQTVSTWFVWHAFEGSGCVDLCCTVISAPNEEIACLRREERKEEQPQTLQKETSCGIREHQVTSGLQWGTESH